MNIRPVDLQVLIPRSTEVSKAQQVTDHQVTVQQQQFSEELQQTMAHRQHQIQGTHKGEGGTVQRDKDERNRRQHNHHRKLKAKTLEQDSECTENNAILDDPVRGHLIDIKT